MERFHETFCIASFEYARLYIWQNNQTSNDLAGITNNRIPSAPTAPPQSTSSLSTSTPSPPRRVVFKAAALPVATTGSDQPVSTYSILCRSST